jgi:hypothetical protein
VRDLIQRKVKELLNSLRLERENPLVIDDVIHHTKVTMGPVTVKALLLDLHNLGLH